MSDQTSPVTTVVDRSDSLCRQVRLNVEPVMSPKFAAKLVAKCDSDRVIVRLTREETQALIADLQARLDAQAGAR